ncbi:hypothetical protein B0H13DRAFT_1025329 [Mycena leptocephala]|nr:hypothetical protein B0H13DRAFT_1025329 [Mycena leptocephala]
MPTFSPKFTFTRTKERGAGRRRVRRCFGRHGHCRGRYGHGHAPLSLSPLASPTLSAARSSPPRGTLGGYGAPSPLSAVFPPFYCSPLHTPTPPRKPIPPVPTPILFRPLPISPPTRHRKTQGAGVPADPRARGIGAIFLFARVLPVGERGSDVRRGEFSFEWRLFSSTSTQTMFFPPRPCSAVDTPPSRASSPLPASTCLPTTSSSMRPYQQQRRARGTETRRSWCGSCRGLRLDIDLGGRSRLWF